MNNPGFGSSLKDHHRKSKVTIASSRRCQCGESSLESVLILLIRAFFRRYLDESRFIVLTLVSSAAYALVSSMPNESNRSIVCTDIADLLSPHSTNSSTNNHFRNNKSDCSLNKRHICADMHVSRLQSEGQCSTLLPTYIKIKPSSL